MEKSDQMHKKIFLIFKKHDVNLKLQTTTTQNQQQKYCLKQSY
jgi:hypothetical protein